MLEYEKKYSGLGCKFIAGTDEAGRGPLAGPVCAAACIMPMDKLIEGINDSKQLSEKKREELYNKIIETAVAFNVVLIDNETIDKINILNATKLAMKQAVGGLSVKPDILLVDAVKGLDISVPYESIIKGDAISYSIAAASILAKVTRDRVMTELDGTYPGYNFKQHKGYPTKEHYAHIEEKGITPVHRKSFLKNIL